jgi:hypothetical protein
MQRYASLSRSSLLVVSVLAASLLFSGKTHAQLANSDFSTGASSLLNGSTVAGLIPPGQTSSTALPDWTATRSLVNGAVIPDSNVYLYTTDPNAFFLPNPPTGSTFGIQLDSTTGFGQNKFATGASITSSPFTLTPGTYQLNFNATTEVGSFNGVPKAGLGGVLVSLNTTTGTNLLSGSTTPAEFTFDTTGFNANASTAKWTPFTTTFSLVAPTTLQLTFADDPRMDLVGNTASSNSTVSGIALVPEPTPLTLIGAVVVSLVGFQTLLKRRRA